MLDENSVFKINNISNVPCHESPELVFLASHQWLLLLWSKKEGRGVSKGVQNEWERTYQSSMTNQPFWYYLAWYIHFYQALIRRTDLWDKKAHQQSKSSTKPVMDQERYINGCSLQRKVKAVSHRYQKNILTAPLWGSNKVASPLYAILTGENCKQIELYKHFILELIKPMVQKVGVQFF